MTETTTIEEVQVVQVTIETKINQALEKANVTDRVIRHLKEKYLPLKINGFDDKEGYEAVKAARKDCKGLRVLASKICKSGREDAVAIQKAWVQKEKEVVGEIGEVEDHLEKQEDEYEAEEQRVKKEEDERKAAVFTNRTIELTQMGAVFTETSFIINDTLIVSASDVRNAPQHLYEEMVLSPCKASFEKKQAVKLAEEARLKEELRAAEEAKAESERVRKEAEAKLAEERQEMERQREEFQRQQQEFQRQKDEAERKQREIEAEEAKKQQEESEKQRKAEWDKQKAIEIEEQSRIAAENAAARERERIEAEQKAAELKKQQEEARKAEELLTASDKEKWQFFLTSLSAVKVPEMRSGQYRKKSMIAKEKIEEIITQ